MKKVRIRKHVLSALLLSFALVLAGCGAQEQEDDEAKQDALTEAENQEVAGGEETQIPNPGEGAQSSGEGNSEGEDTEQESTEQDAFEDAVVYAGEILASYPVKTPVLADLDGDGKEEQVQLWFEEEAHRPTVQIDDMVFGEEEGQDWDYFLSDPWRDEWFIIDIDTADAYKEIAVFDEGPSDDPYTALLRYENGELRYMGGFTAHPENAQITGEGIVYASLRMDILETNCVEGKWQLEKGEDSGEATLQLQERPVYEFLLYAERWNGEYCPVTAKPMQLFVGQDLTADMIVLEPGEMVIPHLYYPDGENGWVEFAYGKDFQYRGFVYVNGHMRIYQTNEAGEELYVDSYNLLEGLLFAD